MNKFLLTLIFISFSSLADTEVNQELFQLYKADQNDRSNGDFTWYRDEQRLEKVSELVSSGQLKVADDFYHAAIIFQHGRISENYKKAHELALRAVELNPSFKKAKWLACAAEDRYLHSLGKPQIWGTQFNGVGCITMEPFDRTVKNDLERIANGVPTIVQLEIYLDKTNKCN